MIKAVLFDLDGTLVNSLSDLAASTNYALNELGFPPHKTEEFRYLVGDGMPKLIERALPENSRSSDIHKKCLDIFMAHYKAHYNDSTYAYPGIVKLLNDLKNEGFKLAVISNKAQNMAEKVAERLLPPVFDAVAGKREGFKTKPDPALTLEIIKELNVKPDECILAGDSGMDMAAAVNSGAFPLGVLWGFRKKDELIENGALYTANTPDDIFLKAKELKNEK